MSQLPEVLQEASPMHLDVESLRRAASSRPVAPVVRSLLLSEQFLPHRGGSRTYYYHLFRGWNPDRVTVLTRKVLGWEEFDAEESSEHFKIVRHFGPRDWSKLEFSKAGVMLAHAAALVKQQAIDVVHTGDLFPQGVIALFLKRFFSVPYVAFSHGEDFTLTDRFRNQSKLRNRIYLAADAVIANAGFSRDRLLKIGVPEERIHKITPGVDCSVFFPADPEPLLMARYGLQNKFVLLTVARLIPRKGHDMVIRALARLAAEFPNLAYLIVGTGPEEAKLRALAAQLNISHLVTFAGFVPDRELPDYYRLGNLMVMPNREQEGDVEGFGITFLEASATGKAVIGGRSGGVAEAVKEGASGELVGGTDLEELISKIRDFLVLTRKAETMGAAGRQRAQAEFDWKQRAATLQSITRSLTTRASQPGRDSGDPEGAAARRSPELS